MKRPIILVLALIWALPLTVVANDGLQTESFVSVRAYTIPDTLQRVPIPYHFLEAVRVMDGFRGYFQLNNDDYALALNLWATEEQAVASNEMARSNISENTPGLLEHPPTFVVGASAVSFVDVPDVMEDQYLQLYASLRVYAGFTDVKVGAFVTLVEKVFQPLIRDTEHFFAYYVIHDSAGRLVTVSVFHEQVRDIVADYLSAFLPDPELVVSGRLDIAALAGVIDAANLVETQQP